MFFMFESNFTPYIMRQFYFERTVPLYKCISIQFKIYVGMVYLVPSTFSIVNQYLRLYLVEVTKGLLD